MKKTPRTMILTLLALATLILAACESSTIGNGQVDPIEEAALRMAVGVALDHHPEAALPAYRVADGLLLVLDPERQATTGELDTALAAASIWRRDWSWLGEAATELGWTSEQIDQMFIAAAAL